MSLSGGVSLRSLGLTTAAAVAAAAAYSLLPRGGELNPMDFLADNATVLELCNPLSAGQLPAAVGRAPVTMTGVSGWRGEGDGRVAGSFSLVAISGRTVGPADLAGMEGRLVRLTLSSGGPGGPRSEPVDARPDPSKPGRWTFVAAPAGPPPFRLSAEFTPRSTGTPLEASSALIPGE